MKRTYKRVARRQAFKDLNQYMSKQKRKDLEQAWDDYRASQEPEDYESSIGE